MKIRLRRLLNLPRVIALLLMTGLAHTAAMAQTPVWHVPQSSTRAVLQAWTEGSGFGVVWSESIPDFPTHERDIQEPFAIAIRVLVSGYGSGRLNLYCPPSIRFPGTAYSLDARVDEGARLVFVFGVPTDQECRPL